MGQEEIYETYRYTYKEVMFKAKIVIYAREDKTAQELIDIANSHSFYKFVPVRFRFKKKCYIDVPPYELEQVQLERQQSALRRRMKIFDENGAFRKSLFEE